MTIKKNVFASLMWGFVGLMLVSCGAEEDTIAPALSEAQEIVEKTDGQALTPSIPLDDISLLANADGRDLIRAIGIGGPMGFVYTQLISTESGRTSGVLSSMRGMRNGSNTAARMAGECYDESFTQTEDSFEYILDFGEGCEIDGVLIKGKIIETGTFTGGTFDDRLEFIGFGGDDWELSGVEVYSGTWSEDNTDAGIWEAAFTYSAEITETYIEDGATNVETISASGEEVWNQDGQTILSGSELTTSDDGDTYFTEITSPLVVNNSCDDGYQYVSGGQSGTYTEVDEDGTTYTSTFFIDFGDGTCDNMIAITENGVTETFDVSKEWELEGSDSIDDVIDEITDGDEVDDLDEDLNEDDEDIEDTENEEDDNAGNDQEDGDLEDQNEEDDLNDDQDSEQDDQDDLEDGNEESEDNDDTENEEGEDDNDGEDNDLEDQEDDDIEDDLDDTEEDDQDDPADEDGENDQEDGEDDDLDDQDGDQDNQDDLEDDDSDDNDEDEDEDENDEDEDQGTGGSNG